MSRQNKVNPGTYTQRGRLTQDDAAREVRKQSAIGPPRPWQPVDTKMGPRLAPAGDAARDTERFAGDETKVETSPAPAHAKAAKAKTARIRKSKRTTRKAETGKAKTGKAMTTAMKRKTTKPTRQAASRKVGGRGAAPRSTTKRRARVR